MRKLQGVYHYSSKIYRLDTTVEIHATFFRNRESIIVFVELKNRCTMVYFVLYVVVKYTRFAELSTTSYHIIILNLHTTCIGIIILLFRTEFDYVQMKNIIFSKQ